MAPVIRGLNQGTSVRITKRYTQKNGEVAVEQYVGPIAAITTLYEAAKDDILAGNVTWDEANYSDADGQATLTLSQAESDNPVNEEDNAIWELTYENEFIPIAQHPYFQISGGFEDQIAIMENAYKRGEDHSTAGSAYSPYETQYWGLRSAGVEGANGSLPVIRKTVTISQRSAITVAAENIDEVVTLTDYPDKLTAIVAAYEWLKRAPTMRSRDGGKTFEIQYTWAGEKTSRGWSKAFYKGSWDPRR
jgi:hypothetical protein